MPLDIARSSHIVSLLSAPRRSPAAARRAERSAAAVVCLLRSLPSCGAAFGPPAAFRRNRWPHCVGLRRLFAATSVGLRVSIARQLLTEAFEEDGALPQGRTKVVPDKRIGPLPSA